MAAPGALEWNITMPAAANSFAKSIVALRMRKFSMKYYCSLLEEKLEFCVSRSAYANYDPAFRSKQQPL
jgi:hypothetical protein